MLISWGKDLTFFLRKDLQRQKKIKILVSDFKVRLLGDAKSPRGSFLSAAKELRTEEGNSRRVGAWIRAVL